MQKSAKIMRMLQSLTFQISSIVSLHLQHVPRWKLTNQHINKGNLWKYFSLITVKLLSTCPTSRPGQLKMKAGILSSITSLFQRKLKSFQENKSSGSGTRKTNIESKCTRGLTLLSFILQKERTLQHSKYSPHLPRVPG